jgi:hypothetical protein
MGEKNPLIGTPERQRPQRVRAANEIVAASTILAAVTRAISLFSGLVFADSGSGREALMMAGAGGAVPALTILAVVTRDPRRRRWTAISYGVIYNRSKILQH